MVYMVSTIPHDPTNPWILLAPLDIDYYGEQMSLSAVELAYQTIQYTSNSPITLVIANGTTSSHTIAPSSDLLDGILLKDEAIQEILYLEEKHWEASPITTPSNDLLNEFQPTDESIREIMCLEEQPWENSHHHVLISDSNVTSVKILPFEPPAIVPSIYTTVQTRDSEGNLANLLGTIPIYISIKTGIVEIIHIGGNYNHE